MLDLLNHALTISTVCCYKSAKPRFLVPWTQHLLSLNRKERSSVA